MFPKNIFCRAVFQPVLTHRQHGGREFQLHSPGSEWRSSMQLAQAGPPRRLLPLAGGALILSLRPAWVSTFWGKPLASPGPSRPPPGFLLLCLRLALDHFFVPQLPPPCLPATNPGQQFPNRHIAFEPAGYDCPAEDAVLLTGATAATPLLSATLEPWRIRLHGLLHGRLLPSLEPSRQRQHSRPPRPAASDS